MRRAFLMYRFTIGTALQCIIQDLNLRKKTVEFTNTGEVIVILNGTAM